MIKILAAVISCGQIIKKAIRLIWDGKESWFILEMANALPNTLFNTLWDEIQCGSYNLREYDLEQINNIQNEMLYSLVKNN
jgi:hypothetical protein